MKFVFAAILWIFTAVNGYSQNLNEAQNQAYSLSNEVEVDSSRSEKEYVISRSTLGLGGSSRTISTSQGTYYVSQSIGQSSVIGTNTNSNYTILQGYQLSSIIVIQTPSVENNLEVIVYPNPFEDSIKISFDQFMENDIFIHVFDMNGRELISETYQPNQLLSVPLKYISIGMYRLLIESEGKRFTTNILKK